MSVKTIAINTDWGQDSTSVTKSNPSGKIKLTEQPTFSSHRSGWAYAISSIAELHNDEGVNFYGFVENEFAWRKDEELAKGNIPFKDKWIGFLHNPVGGPWWFGPKTHPLSYIHSDEFRKSLRKCRGLFCLSNDHANFIRHVTGKKVEVIKHPTEIPDKKFDFEKFANNTNRRLFTIGYWLRKVNSIYALPSNSLYIKTRVLPYKSDSSAKKFVDELRAYEFKYESNSIKEILRWYDANYQNVEELYSLPNDDYDDLFVDNIVFLDMYDSSANNAVIECIARETPILVNPVPSIVEYLGVDYPFYFNDYGEAIDKLNNFDLIQQTHQYLKYCSTKMELSGEYFLNKFKESKIYNSM